MVIVEAISVIVPVAVLDRSYPGGEAGFRSDAPNSTYCCDGEVARVGFMTPQDVGLFVRLLENLGIKYFDGARAIDLVVVDQTKGILETCDWLQSGRATLFGDGEVSTVALVGSELRTLAIPDGWAYEGSMSNPKTHRFIPTGSSDTPRVVRRVGGKDVVRFPDGTEGFVGRPFAIKRDFPERDSPEENPDRETEATDGFEEDFEEPEDDGLDHDATEWRTCDLGPHWATLATFGMGGKGSEFEEEAMLYAHCVDCSSEVLASFGTTSSVTVQPLAETMKWANLLLDQFKYRDLNTRWFHARLYDNV